jgi:hypothetical protein
VDCVTCSAGLRRHGEADGPDDCGAPKWHDQEALALSGGREPERAGAPERRARVVPRRRRSIGGEHLDRLKSEVKRLQVVDLPEGEWNSAHTASWRGSYLGHARRVAKEACTYELRYALCSAIEVRKRPQRGRESALASGIGVKGDIAGG